MSSDLSKTYRRDCLPGVLPYYKGAKEDFAEIMEILKKEETIR